MGASKKYFCIFAAAALVNADYIVCPRAAAGKSQGAVPGASAASEHVSPPGGRPVGREIRIVKKPLSTLFSHKGVTFEGYYPHFEGGPKATADALNKDILDFINGYIPGDEGWGESQNAAGDNRFSFDYTLSLVTDDYVSGKCTIFHYFGGAHGATFLSEINYRLRPSVKKMTLGDVLGAKANYKLLAKALLKKLRAGQQGDAISAPLNVAADDDRFYFDRKGLTWQTGEYSVGPYVAGMPSHTFTYRELAKIAAPGSLALEFLNHKK